MGRTYRVKMLRRTPEYAGPRRGAESITGRPGEVFVALVVARGRVVEHGPLQATVWGSQGNDGPMYKAISNLNTKFRLGHLVWTERGSGYRFVTDDVWVDFYEIERLVMDAQRRLERGDRHGASLKARAAERLWGGYPPIDVPDARDAIVRAFSIQVWALDGGDRTAIDRVLERAEHVLRPDDLKRVRDELEIDPTGDIQTVSRLLDSGTIEDLSRARRICDHILLSRPDYAVAYSLRALADLQLYWVGAPDARPLAEIEAAARHALELDPRCPSAHMTTTLIEFAKGMGENELRQAHAAVQLCPRRCKLAFARALIDTGLSETALVYLSDILSRHPTHRDALELTVVASMHVGDHQVAIDAAQQYEITYGLNGNVAWSAALSSMHLQKFDEAIAMLTRALKIEPYNATLWVQLVRARLLHEGEAVARQIALMVVADLDRNLDKRNFRMLTWFAELAAHAGRADLVDLIAGRVSVEQPPNGYLASRIALAFARLGRLDDAVRRLRTAKEYGFRSVEQLRRELLCFPELTNSAPLDAFLTELDDEVRNLRLRYAS